MTASSAGAPVATAWPVRSTGADGAGAGEAAPELSTETWGEKLYAALPLFIVGGGCLATAIDLYFSGVAGQFGSNSSVHLQLWALFFALAVTGFAAGTFAMLSEEEPEVVAPGAVPVAQTAQSAPEWDESTVEPEEEPSLLGPRTWERSPDLTEGPIAEPMPAATVLSQLDEIEASLRKRPRPPTSE